jgi:alpha-beta hydrolase superfamily lysophospholipase
MPQSREWAFTGTQGEIVGRAWHDDGHSGPTHLILLAHGYGEHLGRYGHVVDRLVARGAVVFGLDHLGHGLSEGERVLVSDFEDVVSDVHTMYELARRDWPFLPVVLIGHSMGGLVAARYAQRYPETLAALVLSGPLIGVWVAGDAMLAAEQIPDVPLDTTTLSRDPAVGRAYEADPLVWHGPFKRATLEAVSRALLAIEEGPSLGDLPCLWLHGGDDQLVPVEGTRIGVEHLRGPGTQERIYPGARHEIFNETNSGEVLDDMCAFIADVLAARSKALRPG